MDNKEHVENNFLKDLAENILKDFEGNFLSLKIILPSKRAVVFFRYYLSSLIKKSDWAPNVITISEWISELTDLEETDKTTLLFDLFYVVKDYIKENDAIAEFYYHFKSPVQFDNFYPFGETLLSDFNEMDAYNVNHKDLFRILKEHAELESVFNYLDKEQIDVIQNFWKGFSEESLSKEQLGFIELWKFLPGLYEKFIAFLIENKKAYAGLNYKLALQKVQSNNMLFDSKINYVFAGFNALNSCEKGILKELNQSNNTRFYWDADSLYINKQEHEAGFFIRELIKEFPDHRYGKKFPSLIEQKKAKINLIGAGSLELQTKALHQQLSTTPTIQNLVSTGIILSDESFLFPTLYSLPKTVNHLNVTMGYAIKDSNLFSFIQSYFELQKNNENDVNSIKTVDILTLIRNPFINKCFKLQITINQILKQRQKSYSHKELIELLNNKFLSILFSRINSGNKAIENLSQFLNSIITKEEEFVNDFTDFEQEFFYYVFTHINQVNELIKQSNEYINISSAKRIIIKGLQSLRVPFTGEPISGLQIMGVLETRTLDFKNLFILGLNEGIWPKISTAPTLIPEGIRRGFGLTTIQHQDSIFAYYFYRLLQRSENVFLYYNNTIGDGIGKEKSRFITQLKELYPELIGEIQEIQIPLFNTPVNDIIINRSLEIKQILAAYSSKTISATAINQYLSCSLKFYFKNIIKLKEPDRTFDEVGPIEIGLLFHNTMDFLYTPYKGKKLQNEDLKSINKSIDKCIQEAFNMLNLEDKNKTYQLSAEDKIIRHLVKKYVQNVLTLDKRNLPFTIIDVEAIHKRTIRVKNNSNNVDINLKGIIDRIDEKNGNYYLVDYKTGSDLLSVRSIENLFDKDFKNIGKKPKAILQMFLYSYIFQSKFPTKKIKPLLYLIKNLKETEIKIGKEIVEFHPDHNSSPEELMPTFVHSIQSLLEEIFFSDLPFQKTNDLDQCTYCPYVNICGR